MALPSATSNAFYYERQTLFTVLVWVSLLTSIAGMVFSIVGIIYGDFDPAFLDFLCYLFILNWNIQILRKKSYFFEGNLTNKCSPWLYVASGRFLIGIVFVIEGPVQSAVTSFISSAIYILAFVCYCYWSFFRPWKQVQQMPVYMVHQPIHNMGQPAPMTQNVSSPQ